MIWAKLLLVAVLASQLTDGLRMRTGEMGQDDLQATAEVQALVDQVRGQVEEMTNALYTNFQAVIYKTQLVSGTNFFVKAMIVSFFCFVCSLRLASPQSSCEVVFVLRCLSRSFQVDVGNGNYIHVRIYRKLPGDVSLVAVLTDKAVDDPIIYFP